VIHNAYRVVPGRFKDYISTRSPTATARCTPPCSAPGPAHRDADPHHGDARDRRAGRRRALALQAGRPPTDGKQYRWLRELLDILEHAAGPRSSSSTPSSRCSRTRCSASRPRATLIALPRGATPVDFAYAVHSGRRHLRRRQDQRPPGAAAHAAANGDQVEIVTSKAQTPSPTWERFVVTGKARARIRRFIRTQQRHQYISLGREILDKTFRQAAETLTEKALDGVLKSFKVPSVEELYVQVGEGHVTGASVLHAVFPGRKDKPAEMPVPTIKRGKGADKKSKLSVPIRGLIPGMAVHYAGCCHPLPGDRIVGIVTTGKGVSIHTIDCETLEQYSEQPERWIDVGWEGDAVEAPRVGRIDVVISNEPGSLGNLTTAIGKSEGNIHNLKITNRSQDFFEILVDIEVRNVKHLTNIIAALRATPTINSVERARG
jgi:guanosine-3',5'-bis(diphosphate) 3'-pyrophosphohydrolase